jgi:glycerol kinase
MNTGNIVVPSTRGLLTTVAFKLGNHAPVYALEGSVAYCGSLIQWLRDNLGLLTTTAESEALASKVNDHGGLFFVPAFSGLFAPYWRDDARGVIVGMTAFNNKHHLVRAALESAAFQILEVLEAMEKDSGVQLQMLKVDGGMTENKLLMQFQADLLDVSVLTPQTKETTALGAAFAAGLAVGFWKNFEELRCIWSVGKKWDPYMPTKTRESLIANWKKAVQRSLCWVDKSTEEEDASGLGGVPLKLMRYASFSTSGPTGMVGGEGGGFGHYSATRAWGALVIGTLSTLGLGLVLGSKWHSRR